MDLEFISTKMEQSTKDYGKKTCNMVEVKNLGLTEAGTKETMSKVVNRELDRIYGTMVHYIRANGRITESRALEFICGLMVENLKGNGMQTIWKDMELIIGVTVANTMVNIRMIRSMDMGCIPGLMADSMKDTGLKESSMVLVFILILRMEV